MARAFDVRLELPGSKSYSNRAIVCAALAGAPCEIANLSPADDTALMLNVLADLGWRVTRSNPHSREVRLEPPVRPYSPPHEVQIFTGAAGTATRFALALLTVLPGKFVLDGSARMRERPMGELIDALRQLGAKIRERGETGCLPLAIDGASLRGGSCTLRGDVSSQFVSALLMIAAVRDVEFRVEGELVSKPYVDMTIEVMRAFGVPVERDGYRRFRSAGFRAAGGRDTRSPYVCPPDATAAGYFWGAAAVTKSRCVIDGLTRQDPQPDVRLVDVLERMGCAVVEFSNGLGIDASTVGELRAVQADMADMPDSAQTLAVVCAFARGTSRLTGLRTLRVKETDRIAALQSELAKLGVKSRAGEDWLEVEASRIGMSEPPPGMPEPLIQTYEDHRMAMSFAIAGLRLPLAIQNPGCVAKSFPGFWEAWSRMKQQPPA